LPRPSLNGCGSDDYDYTDWADVRAFAEEFRRRVVAAA
jgi:menaquinone-dependent protoporphyrinogen IX oxidase